MLRLRTLILASALTALALPALAGSAKRGVCWDEKYIPLTTHHAALLGEGVCWVYNWGPDAAVSEAYNDAFTFAPMAWNGACDFGRMRSWLDKHPATRWLLGFNEPNFADQARMTPAEAAAVWPELEKIAADYGLRLVAPALNFPPSQVGGRIWSPYEWYDEFFRLLPEAKVDCLAMHCYMNWTGAMEWLVTDYFYSDLYDSRKECYGLYPHLVAFLDSYKAARGTFPPMMLTEFCALENDGAIKDVDFQIDQMTQKLQKLEKSELVEGYAWFMANMPEGASAYPYMSMLESCTTTSALSTLGTVYVHMSAFDTNRHYGPGELIAAKDYVDATCDERAVRLRPNSESGSAVPLQVEIPASGYTEYLIDVPADGTYTLSFRFRSDAEGELTLYTDSRKGSSAKLADTAGAWTDATLTASISKGKHSLMPYNSGATPFTINALTFNDESGVELPVAGESAAPAGYFDLTGRFSATPPEGFYLQRMPDGRYIKKFN